MKRRMIVCITLAAILLVVGAAYWAFCCLPHLTGSTIKNADSYLLDAQNINKNLRMLDIPYFFVVGRYCLLPTYYFFYYLCLDTI